MSESSVPPERERMAQGKKLLMEAAARLAARQGGTRQLALRELAREAGLNHNTFYRHFSSIDEMVAAILEAFATELRSGLTQARQAVRPGDSVSKAVVGWLFDFAKLHGDVFVMAVREQYGPPGESRDGVRHMMRLLRQDMARDLAASGRLPPMCPDRLDRVLRIIVEQCLHLCMDYLELPRRRGELLETADEMFQTLIAGAIVLEGAVGRR